MQKLVLKNPVPLPSPIHYELLLQILERRTLSSIPPRDVEAREQVQSIIIMLRKALLFQKQFEENCARSKTPTSYRWSLNELTNLSKEWDANL